MQLFTAGLSKVYVQSFEQLSKDHSATAHKFIPSAITDGINTAHQSAALTGSAVKVIAGAESSGAAVEVNN